MTDGDHSIRTQDPRVGERRLVGDPRHRRAAYPARPRLRHRTKLEPGARIVTFVNGMVLREPIVTLDDEARRLVWTAEGGRARHYNAALQVSELADGLTSVVWTADFLPDDVSGFLSKAIEAGMAAMQRSLDALAA
jgi:Polyketide cyclase / dehydrase and lipid transport